MYVFDAAPLIYLAKADRHSSVDELPPACVTPELVYEEVVTAGLAEGYPDARRIERAVEDGVLDVAPVEVTATLERLRRNENLGDADAVVLALASERDGTAVVDERYGRMVADAEGIETRGTASVILRLLREGAIDAEEVRATIDGMIDAGRYFAPALYAKILRKIEELG
ncbi:DUF3368 domain-containing protein [Halovivax sp.]|uniref:DUF3368 domain-containing protein n=1 Tax=Halovivax sp. TaxID=1935978 RepID=UPI0025B97535|nr:DUF3368 domain-containing protein [Halovivax sp.]